MSQLITSIAGMLQTLASIRLVVTDVDGVHTNDKVTIFVSPEKERLVFGLQRAGDTQIFAEPGKKLAHQYSVGLDGRIEGYTFYTGDGIAIKECLRHEIPVVLISGRRSPAVKQRATDLGAKCLQGIADKVAAVEEVVNELDITWDQVLFIGNDIQDLSLVRKAGYAAAPSDAAAEVRREADYVSTRAGGDGVVRDVLQKMLGAKGLWEPIISRNRTLG